LNFPLLKGDGIMGKKKLSHDQKRKAKLAKKGAKLPKASSLAYEGAKYKTDELVPLFHQTELGILQAYKATRERFTDHTVRKALEKLVLQMRQGQLPPVLGTDIIQVEADDNADQELVINSIRRNWQNLDGFAASRDNKIGVLRTLLSSVETWSSPGKGSRGYLAYLEGFLAKAPGTPVDYKRLESEEFEDDEEESELLALGRDWYSDQDLDAAADFKELAQRCIQDGENDYVVEVCQQLIGECMDNKAMVATLSALSLRAQEAMKVGGTKTIEFQP
jgi:hypothetical protein